MEWALYPVELRLRNTFRIAHGASTTRHNVLLNLDDGWGEAAAVAYHGETAAKIQAWLERYRATITSSYDPAAISWLLGKLDFESRAARAAVDLALHDRLGQQLGVPLRHLLGLNGLELPQTSVTLPIEEAEALRQQALAVAHYPILKVKLGGPADLASVAIIREAAPNSRIRVDANAGWSRETAATLIPALADLGVELVEQPLAVDDFDGYAQLKAANYGVPIFADEPIKNAADVARWASLVDGVNLKLMKTGGIVGAQAAIATARAHGLQLMLGCMIESSIGVSAACALAGLVDFVDLDGPLLIANDLATGLSFETASIQPSAAPGLGVQIDWPALNAARLETR